MWISAEENKAKADLQAQSSICLEEFRAAENKRHETLIQTTRAWLEKERADALNALKGSLDKKINDTKIASESKAGGDLKDELSSLKQEHEEELTKFAKVLQAQEDKILADVKENGKAERDRQLESLKNTHMELLAKDREELENLECEKIHQQEECKKNETIAKITAIAQAKKKADEELLRKKASMELEHVNRCNEALANHRRQQGELLLAEKMRLMRLLDVQKRITEQAQLFTPRSAWIEEESKKEQQKTDKALTEASAAHNAERQAFKVEKETLRHEIIQLRDMPMSSEVEDEEQRKIDEDKQQ